VTVDVSRLLEIINTGEVSERVDEFAGDLFRFIKSRVPKEVALHLRDDVVQESFIQVYTRVMGSNRLYFEREEGLEAYLSKVTIAAAYRVMGKNRIDVPEQYELETYDKGYSPATAIDYVFLRELGSVVRDEVLSRIRFRDPYWSATAALFGMLNNGSIADGQVKYLSKFYRIDIGIVKFLREWVVATYRMTLLNLRESL